MRTFTKVVIKFALIIGLIIFAFVNYKYLDFNKGWSIVTINDKDDARAIRYIDDIPTRIEYYKLTIPSSEYEYKIFIETNEKNYLFFATQDDLDTMDFIGIFAKDIKPKLISPIPFYVEIIIALIIIFIPFGKRESIEYEEPTGEN